MPRYTGPKKPQSAMGKKKTKKKIKSTKKGTINNAGHEGVDFVTRMDRKLRATRLKLEQKRKAKYKAERDAARTTNMSWAQVAKGGFKRLSEHT